MLFTLIALAAFSLSLSLFLIEYRSVFARDAKQRRHNRAFYGKSWKLSLASVVLSGMLATLSTILTITLITNT
ncbi:hypothetical protein NQV05_02215 [Mycoplasmopsis agalactiae]|uniref:hypothetical protein n=1 Tax=Mycoplasmopsis agalactiae TaxID=2110 RepID=UPI001F3757B4|nr:hypothetical protein [Mycoplasmopsis agalactiae]MCE6090911.1 hypothetical protein [Mycoplasmopsis agalactiae]UUM25198.1 hypothetical protein NQV05_02215 [Mycoplasmopsis agalactiae]